MWAEYDVEDRVIYQGDRLGTVIEQIGETWSCGDGCCTEFYFEGYRLLLDDGNVVECAEPMEVEDAPPNDPGSK